ncbi:integrase [Sphingomonas sp.]|uniref:integrase n=1 Tax=Sphingomonas sp. TaxID=28214 RepID=UPI0038A46065
MAKTLTEAKITTREQRKKLASGVHWRGVDPEVHLGYRKGKRGGSWLVRWYDGKKYQQRTFGTADDELREGTLDFAGAVKEARQVVEKERRTARAAAAGPLLSVRLAVETYMASRDARDCARKGRTVRSDASSRLSRYVAGQNARGKRKAVPAAPLAEIHLHELTEGDLLEWRAELPETLKGTSKRRLINDLKAALNTVYTNNRSRLPTHLPATIKHGLRTIDSGEEAEPIARENQILSDRQLMDVMGAVLQIDAEQGWGGDLARIMTMLAATGARFSQVARLRVGDVLVDASRVMMPVSRKGRTGKTGSAALRIGPDAMEAILPAISGRSKTALLFERWRKKQVPGGIQWEQGERGPWRSASELARPWAAIRERAGLGEGVVLYALRHSSIVRGLKKQPIRWVAALHDTSVTMIERHYSRFIAEVDDVAALSVVPLFPESRENNVVSLTRV